MILRSQTICAFLCIAALVSLLSAAPPIQDDAQIEFLRDVRPILTQHCYACHGPDASQRKSDLRLDSREGMLRQLESGRRGVVPSDASASLIIERIFTGNQDERMPPPDSNHGFGERERRVLRDWVTQGANWQEHWAYQPIQRPTIPGSTNPEWQRTPIDVFISDRLHREHLSPSEVADKRVLARRAALSLTGMPLGPYELAMHLNCQEPDADDRLLDRLLASPRYGERFASWWLDLARYADTHGYHVDSHRDMWRWRDWVIEALNAGMPFDQFTIEQIAGDALPHATLSQRIATGFNRNNMINFENGALADEYLAEYITDRVVTTSTVWLAQTMQCAKCHDHKYDPLSQREFFGMFAYFDQLPEKGLDGEKGNAAPFIEAPTELQLNRLTALTAEIESLARAIEARLANSDAGQKSWETEQLKSQAKLAAVPKDFVFALLFDDEVDAAKLTVDVASVPPTASGDSQAILSIKATESLERVTSPRGQSLLCNGEVGFEISGVQGVDAEDAFSASLWLLPTTKDRMYLMGRITIEPARRGWDWLIDEGHLVVRLMHNGASLLEVRSRGILPLNKWTQVGMSYDGSGRSTGIRLYIRGEPDSPEVVHETLAGSFDVTTPFRIGHDPEEGGFRGLMDDVQYFTRALSTEEMRSLSGSDPIRDILAKAVERRTADEQRALRLHYLESVDSTYRNLKTQLADAERRLAKFRQSIPTVMVMQDVEPRRPTHILKRGRYDQKGEVVLPSPPTGLFAWTGELPPNRLGLAKWLASPKNPLTPRVLVNRVWELHFGTGLVRTSEDFGTRGELPSHPDLLDWLSSEFMETGWDCKRLHRLLLSSATYRQSSRLPTTGSERDPQNRLLARGPRLRLSAEMVRDSALLAADLLVETVGGPSVRPYQPDGLWEEVSYDAEKFTAQVFTQDHGRSLYRRSLYTFWKRSVPPPNLSALDAPEREVCTVGRSRTNTPLQSLVLMNDPTFVEAARGAAQRVLHEGGTTFESRLGFAFELVLGRPPMKREIKSLESIFQEARDEFHRDRDSAGQLLKVGESARDERLSVAEHAAWTLILNTLMSTDEAITNE